VVVTARGWCDVQAEFFDGDGLLARWTTPTDADPAHERPALVTPLFANGSCATSVALVDGDQSSGLGGGNGDGDRAGVAAPSVAGSATRVGAVPLSADRRERALAHRAVHRDAIVTRRNIAREGSTGDDHDRASPTVGF